MRALDTVRHARRQVAVSLPRLPIIGSALRRSGTASVDGLSPEAILHARSNFRLGVINGILFTLVDGLISPTLVLAWFISRLGAPNVLVGLLPAIINGGWFLPQLIVATRVSGLPRMMHWYSRVGVLRTLCMTLIAVTTLLLSGNPPVLLIAFFFFYTVYAFSAGVSGIPWLEVVGKVIAPRRRGSFFGHRNFWGGLLALLVAGPVGAVMSEQLWGLTFPHNFVLLFGVTAAVVGGGVWSWSVVKEPAATVVSQAQLTVKGLVQKGMQAMRSDADYRSFTIIRILLALATVSDPFYVVYAKTQLGAPAEVVGLYLGAVSLSSLLSNFLWSPLADRVGNRTLMTWTVLATTSVPLMAVLASLLSAAIDKAVLYDGFALVFVFSGLALGASRIVNNNMLLAIAPPDQRPVYIGFLNTILGVAIFVPVLGGVAIDLFGFLLVFVTSVLLAGSSIIAVRRMSSRKLA